MASPRPWTLTISSSVFRGSSRFSTGRPNAPSSTFRSAYSKRSRISRVARTRPTMSRCSSSATELLLLLSPQTPTRHCPLRLHPRPPPPLHPHATLLLLSPQPPRTKHEALPGNCLLAHSLSRGNEGKAATAGRSKIKRAGAVTGPALFRLRISFPKIQRNGRATTFDSSFDVRPYTPAFFRSSLACCSAFLVAPLASAPGFSR